MAGDARAPRRIAAHVANLANADDDVVARAERYLKRYGSRAVPQLIAACGHPEGRVRCRAAWILGKIGDPAAFEVLLPLAGLLEHPDEWIRTCAVDALEAIREDHSPTVSSTASRHAGTGTGS